jgi:pyridoxine 5-phosphate synthase
MTVLSVNVNKIALLRNSRGRDYPSVLDFIDQLRRLGVHGITVHPRPDERHVRRCDVYEIRDYLRDYPDIEFNIEGYPSPEFMTMMLEVRPVQCTLVPDKPGQLTSDHGWDVQAESTLLAKILGQLRDAGIRSSLFLDPDPARVAEAAALQVDRIELYTEDYARAFGTTGHAAQLDRYRETAAAATTAGIGLNAGHDLNLDNLAAFLAIPNILEVSIGHALVVESLQWGLPTVIERYLAITGA